MSKMIKLPYEMKEVTKVANLNLNNIIDSLGENYKGTHPVEDVNLLHQHKHKQLIYESLSRDELRESED